MHYREILSRLTGISTPVFGVSWNPTEPQLATARRVLTFLEDRRIFYNAFHIEVEDQCIQCATDIRRFLPNELGHLETSDPLAQHLRGIRAACRYFLDSVGSAAQGRVHRPPFRGPKECAF